MNLPPPSKGRAVMKLPPPSNAKKASMNLPPPVSNGAYRPTAVKSAGKSMMLAKGSQPNDSGERSKSGSIEMGISSVPGKAPISKVPGKAPITKVPGKAPIVKVPPAQAEQPATLLKTSAKRPSK